MSKICCKHCDTQTSHSKDHYYIRSGDEDCFLLMFFKTSFIYKKDGRILTGEKFHYIINPPFDVAEHGSLKEGFINDWIFFKGEEAQGIIEDFNLPLNTPFYISDHSIIFPYINKISTELVLKHTAYESKISAIITDMLINLGRQYELSLKSMHPAFSVIDSIRNYMFSHIEDKITLKDLARRSNYSESRFCTLYNMFYSSSPIDDLLNARIEKAISLLEYNHISVTQTARMCGFSSIHYFSNKFKEKTGVSPSEYLKKSDKKLRE